MPKAQTPELEITTVRFPACLLDALDREVERQREANPHLSPGLSRSGLIRTAVAIFLERQAARDRPREGQFI